MQENRNEFKKQALQYIISKYLTRRNNQDIEFIRQNTFSTSELVSNVGSSLIKGLDRAAILVSENVYGQNNKRASMGLSLGEVLMEQLMNYHFIGMVLLSLTSIITGEILERYELTRDGLWILVFIVSLHIFRVGIWYKTEFDLHRFSQDRDKTDVYRVLRSGQFVEIAEEKLVTGDIVELGYKEKVPASGMLVTRKEILVNQEILGHRIERKMTLEQCVEFIQSMSNLELRLAYENSQLPSPVLIRGTEVVYGSGQMIILALEDEELINKHQQGRSKLLGCKQLDDWREGFVKKWNKICISFTISLLLLSVGLFIIRKWLLREVITFERIFPEIIKLIMMIGGTAMLFDKKTIDIFFKVRFTKYTMMIRQPQQVKKVLTASQVLITEENIVRYDQVAVEKIASLEKRDLIQISEAKTLSENQIEILNEVINGVLLKSPFDSNKREPGDESRNQIIQTYKTYRRIVTQLQETGEQHPKISDNRALFQINRESVQSNIQVSKNEHELISVIRANCKYTTKKILNGLMQIAEKKGKTYYYNKFTQEDLKAVCQVHFNGKKSDITKDQREKVKMMARKIIIENLIPIMLGYSDGFDSQSQMKVFVGIIGIRKECRNAAVDQLQRLEDIGIRTLILIPKEPDSEPQNVRDLALEFEGKGWLQFRDEETCEMSNLRRNSGRLICGSCLIANCDCKNRVEEVSDILRFMKQTNSVKVIYGVTSETDIYYLECAYTQIRETFLSITNHHARTVEAINDIFEGFKLIEGTEKGVCFFIVMGLISMLCLSFFGVVEGHVFFNRQMLGFLLLGHGFPLLGFTADLAIEVKKTPHRNRRIITLFTRYTTLKTAAMCVLPLAMVLFLYYYPYLIPESPHDNQIYTQIQQMNPLCEYGSSTFIIPAFAAENCLLPNSRNDLNIPYLVYSRHSTFLLNYLFSTIYLFYMINFGNWRSYRTVISYIAMGLMYLMILLTSSSAMQIYFMSITAAQFFISLSLSLGTIMAVYLLSYVLNSALECFDQDLDISLHFDEDSSKHYSSVLKKYLNYSDQFILMRREDD